MRVCVHPSITPPSSILTNDGPTVHTQESVGAVETTSGLYESKAQYVENQPDFLNAVCRLRTRLDPPALLRELKRVERNLGRVPSIRYASAGSVSNDSLAKELAD